MSEMPAQSSVSEHIWPTGLPSVANPAAILAMAKVGFMPSLPKRDVFLQQRKGTLLLQRLLQNSRLSSKGHIK
jgi:hypothetical protein